MAKSDKATEFHVLENGPLMVKGNFKLSDSEGKEIKHPGADIFLCRCGATNNSPFCDGSHKKVSFHG